MNGREARERRPKSRLEDEDEYGGVRSRRITRKNSTKSSTVLAEREISPILPVPPKSRSSSSKKGTVDCKLY